MNILINRVGKEISNRVVNVWVKHTRGIAVALIGFLIAAIGFGVVGLGLRIFGAIIFYFGFFVASIGFLIQAFDSLHKMSGNKD